MENKEIVYTYIMFKVGESFVENVYAHSATLTTREHKALQIRVDKSDPNYQFDLKRVVEVIDNLHKHGLRAELVKKTIVNSTSYKKVELMYDSSKYKSILHIEDK